MNLAPDTSVVGYAQPLSRLQVSWGAILAGAATLLAVALILWILALAIILTATRPTVDSFSSAILAAGICAIATILIGGFAGGMVAGYLPGNPRRLVTMAHSFLAWCVAFIVASGALLAVVGFVVRGTATAAIATTTTAVETAGAAVGEAVSQENLGARAESVLVALGYSGDEAKEMVSTAQASLQRVLRGTDYQPGSAAAQARGAVDTLLDWAALMTWLFFVAWLASLALAVVGGAIVIGRVRKVPDKEREVAVETRPSPLEPAPGPA
ncbi:MAG: hypothetical protein V2A73_02920 [Pseudomonadota bacterium]